MSQGLRVWNAGGQLVLSITTQLSRMTQSGVLTGSLSAGASATRTITVSGMLNNGRWAVLLSVGTAFPMYYYWVNGIGSGSFSVLIKAPFISRNYEINYAVYTR